MIIGDTMDDIRIKVMGKEIMVSKGITLLELSKQFLSDFKFVILGAYVNHVVKELDYVITKSCEISFFDLTEKIGNTMYVNALIYTCFIAIKRKYGSDKDIYVEHSIDKGIFITTNFDIDEGTIYNLEQEIKAIVQENLPIKKVNTSRIDAIKYFENIGDLSKARMLKYNTNTYISLYKLYNHYDYFFTPMPISTSCLTDFDLTCIETRGFVLRFPTVHTHYIKEYRHHEAIFHIYKEYRQWQKTIRIENVSDLNQLIGDGKINDLIRMDEVVQNTKLMELAKNISDDRRKIRVILIAGPSSSGKTTTANKLCMYLSNYGLTPKMLSLDDYFKDRKDTPKNEDGSYDFESLEALDLSMFNDQISRLLNGEEVIIPTFDFQKARKEFRETMTLNSDDILLIEGIHCLNPNLLPSISNENKFKIYLSPFTKINIDAHNRFSTSDNRIIRRIVRDNRTRGTNVEGSLERWESVRGGEEKYIFPYQDQADYVFNSAFLYELGVLRTYVEPLLYSVDEDSKYYEEARRLLNLIKVFLPIPSEAIPDDSILREFIGGSCFNS